MLSVHVQSVLGKESLLVDEEIPKATLRQRLAHLLDLHREVSAKRHQMTRARREGGSRKRVSFAEAYVELQLDYITRVIGNPESPMVAELPHICRTDAIAKGEQAC